MFLFPAALKRTTACVAFGFLSKNAKKRFVSFRIIWTPAAVSDEHCLQYTCSFSHPPEPPPVSRVFLLVQKGFVSVLVLVAPLR